MLDADDPILAALRMIAEELTPFDEGRGAKEARDRLSQVAAWVTSVTTQNHDGVTLTPTLVRYLAGGDLAERLSPAGPPAGGDPPGPLRCRLRAAAGARVPPLRIGVAAAAGLARGSGAGAARLRFPHEASRPPSGRGPSSSTRPTASRPGARRTRPSACCASCAPSAPARARPVVVVGNDRYGRIFRGRAAGAIPRGLRDPLRAGALPRVDAAYRPLPHRPLLAQRLRPPTSCAV